MHRARKPWHFPCICQAFHSLVLSTASCEQLRCMAIFHQSTRCLCRESGMTLIYSHLVHKRHCANNSSARKIVRNNFSGKLIPNWHNLLPRLYGPFCTFHHELLGYLVEVEAFLRVVVDGLVEDLAPHFSLFFGVIDYIASTHSLSIFYSLWTADGIERYEVVDTYPSGSWIYLQHFFFFRLPWWRGIFPCRFE